MSSIPLTDSVLWALETLSHQTVLREKTTTFNFPESFIVFEKKKHSAVAKLINACSQNKFHKTSCQLSITTSTISSWWSQFYYFWENRWVLWWKIFCFMLMYVRSLHYFLLQLEMGKIISFRLFLFGRLNRLENRYAAGLLKYQLWAQIQKSKFRNVFIFMYSVCTRIGNQVLYTDLR